MGQGWGVLEENEGRGDLKKGESAHTNIHIYKVNNSDYI